MNRSNEAYDGTQPVRLVIELQPRDFEAACALAAVSNRTPAQVVLDCSIPHIHHGMDRLVSETRRGRTERMSVTAIPSNG